jgi:hypothetical protein
VRRTPGLERRFRVYEGYRRIKCLRTDGTIQVFAADDRTGDGVIFTLALLEELHRHPDLRLYRTWHGKIEKRGGQVVAISTAGEPGGEYENVKASVLKRGRLRRRGAHTVARTKELVLHQHALTDGDDVHDLKKVKQANPFSGVTLAGLKRKHDSPTMLESHWARFVCGIPTRGDAAAITAGEWAGLRKTKIPAGDRGPRRRRPRLEVGHHRDRPAVDADRERRVLGVPEVIVPPRDGTSTPPELIRAAARRIHERTPVHTWVVEDAAGAEQFVEWLQQEFPDARVVLWGTGNQPQSLAFDRWMEAVREGWLEHPHDELLTQHVLNAVAKPAGPDRYRFDRPRTTRQARGQDQRVIDSPRCARRRRLQLAPYLVEGNGLIAKFRADGEGTPPTEPDPARLALHERDGHPGRPRPVLDQLPDRRGARDRPQRGRAPRVALPERLEHRHQPAAVARDRDPHRRRRAALPEQLVRQRGPPVRARSSSPRTRRPRRRSAPRCAPQVEAQHKGIDNAFKIAVLSGGMDWKPMSFSAAEAQLIDTRRAAHDDVCIAYDVKHSVIAEHTGPGTAPKTTSPRSCATSTARCARTPPSPSRSSSASSSTPSPSGPTRISACASTSATCCAAPTAKRSRPQRARLHQRRLQRRRSARPARPPVRDTPESKRPARPARPAAARPTAGRCRRAPRPTRPARHAHPTRRHRRLLTSRRRGVNPSRRPHPCSSSATPSAASSSTATPAAARAAPAPAAKAPAAPGGSGAAPARRRRRRRRRRADRPVRAVLARSTPSSEARELAERLQSEARSASARACPSSTRSRRSSPTSRPSATLEAERDAARGEVTNLTRGGWVRSAASAAGFHDAEDAIARIDLAEIKTEAAAKREVEALAERAKHLVRRPDDGKPPASTDLLQQVLDRGRPAGEGDKRRRQGGHPARPVQRSEDGPARRAAGVRPRAVPPQPRRRGQVERRAPLGGVRP